MRKPASCICENKDASDQRLCFRYLDSTIPLLPKSEILSILPSSVAVQPDFCRTWSETPKTDFLKTRLIYFLYDITIIASILHNMMLQKLNNGIQRKVI